MNIVGETPDWNEQLWRYFKTGRFIELLDTSSLYFSSARDFEDQFEGAIAVIPAGISIDPRYSDLESVDYAFEQLRRLTKVSCWHRADYESDG